MTESIRLPSPVIQLARALVHSPEDGDKKYFKLQAGLPEGLRKPPPKFEPMIDAMLELKGHRSIPELVQDAIQRWTNEQDSLRKRAFAAVLGAAHDELVSKAVRLGLDEGERDARAQIRRELYRETG